MPRVAALCNALSARGFRARDREFSPKRSHRSSSTCPSFENVSKQLNTTGCLCVCILVAAQSDQTF